MPLGHSSAQTGLHPETSAAQVNSPDSLNRRSPPSREVFFKLLLNFRFALGMLRVWLYFPPAMTSQQSIRRRHGNGTPQSLHKSGMYRRNRKHSSLNCLNLPTAEKFPFLFYCHSIMTPATPGILFPFILLANTSTITKHRSLTYSQYIRCLVS